MTRQFKPLTSVIPSAQPQDIAAPTCFDNTLPTKEVLEIWRNAEAVCFDVDSTVCLDEGIDELAEFCGAGKAVAEWTARAMSGSVPFEEALAARLSLFNPSLSQLHDFLEKRPPRLTPGITDLIKKLKAKKTDVYLISGGFRQMIQPVALQLGIPPENIFANQLLFGSSGEFCGFDINEPTSRSGGKATIPVALQLGIPPENIFANQLLFGSSGGFCGFDINEPTSRSGGKATTVQNIRKVHGYRALVMIGDGATDQEACKPGGADLFICYAGVQLRESVAAKADWLVFQMQDLITSLE